MGVFKAYALAAYIVKCLLFKYINFVTFLFNNDLCNVTGKCSDCSKSNVKNKNYIYSLNFLKAAAIALYLLLELSVITAFILTSHFVKVTYSLV